jgi:hypothetical protein
MKTKIKVTLEYMGKFKTANSQDYRLVKIVGAPTVEVFQNGRYDTIRVSDIIAEDQATELSTRVEVTTVPKKV